MTTVTHPQAVGSQDPATAFQAARETFRLITEPIDRIAGHIESESALLRDAIERLQLSQRLFSSVLPLNTPEDRGQLENWLPVFLNMAGTFEGICDGFAIGKHELPKLTGISRELTASVRKCDQAFFNATATLRDGQDTFSAIVEIIENRLSAE